MPKPVVELYQPTIPFLSRLVDRKSVDQENKFLTDLKKLQHPDGIEGDNERAMFGCAKEHVATKGKRPMDFLLYLVIGHISLSNALADFGESAPWEQDDFMEEANLLNVSLNCEIEDFFKLNDLDVPLVSPFIDFTDSDDDDGDVNNERQEMMERKGDYETIIDETYSIVEIENNSLGFLANHLVLEDLEEYIDDVMTQLLFGRKFKELTKLEDMEFVGLILFLNSKDEVSYVMPLKIYKLRHLSHEVCNKIPPILLLKEMDERNGFKYPYKKMKGFYKKLFALGSGKHKG
ncbi:hypothetical protein Tco_0564565 [Tanacetum coccineum]